MKGSSAVRREFLLLVVLVAAGGVGFLGTRALADSNAALRRQDSVAWLARGRQALDAGDVPGALIALRRAAHIDRANREVSLSLATALSRAGQASDAAAVLEVLKEADPGDAQVNIELARLEAGRGELPQAIRYYQDALDTLWAPDVAEQGRVLRTELIELLLRHGQRARALSQALVLAADIPAEPGWQLTAGRLLLAAGDARRALDRFTAVLAVNPSNAEARAGAGESAFDLGDYARARRYLAGVAAADARLASLREIAGLVLTADPLAPRLSVSERNRRLESMATHAADELDRCAAAATSPDPVRAGLRQELAARMAPPRGGARAARSDSNRAEDIVEPLGAYRARNGIVRERRRLQSRRPDHCQHAWPDGVALMEPGANAEQLRLRESRLFLALSILVGILAGLAAVLFSLCIDRLSRVLFGLEPSGIRLFAVPAGFSLITGVLLSRWFPDVRGSGIPQTEAAFHLKQGVIPGRVAIGKFITGVLCVGSGHSMGREGPSVQIGASIASTIGRWAGVSPERVKALVPVGAAGALAAAFNTPVAAVLFSLEEIIGNMNASLIGSTVVASVASVVVERSILGNEPLFHVPSYQLVHPGELAAYAVLGVVGGIVSIVFCKTLLAARAGFKRLPAWTQMLQPAIGGVVIGLLLLIRPEVMGVGYDYVDQALNGNMVLKTLIILCLMKMVATIVSYSSGNAGGIFAPTLYLGAMAGGAIGTVVQRFAPFPTAAPGAYALVGMGTLFAGIIRAPMTSVFMMFEITQDYQILVPLMVANLLSFVISQAVSACAGLPRPAASGRCAPAVGRLPVVRRGQDRSRCDAPARGAGGAGYADSPRRGTTAR